MATWPTSLPTEPLQEGYREAVPETAIRTSMDVGPPKVRRRATAGVRPIQMRLLCTSSQYQDLEAFYATTLNGGTLTFDWSFKPLGSTSTGSLATYRFRRPPQLDQVLSNRLMRVALELEVPTT